MKTVLISPDAKTIEYSYYAVKLLKLVSKKLLKNGYQVFLNCSDTYGWDERIRRVDWRLNCILEKCDCLEMVIGLRSGFMDLISFSKTKVIVLYPNGYDMKSFFEIRKENVIEYILTQKRNEDIKHIMNIAGIQKGE